MLGRRFTIVCLLLALFSMFFASLVAQGRSERTGKRAPEFPACSTRSTAALAAENGKAKVMNRIGNTITRTLRLLPRAALIGMLIAVPVLAVPSLADSRDTVIEAPTPKKMGAGFVLLISLQRA